MTDEQERINKLADTLNNDIIRMQCTDDIGELNMYYASARKNIELLWGRKFQLIKAEKAEEEAPTR